MSIHVRCDVPIYERNGEETTDPRQKQIHVDSHWNMSDRVVLEMPNGERYTVTASDLKRAVDNATNHA